MTVHCTHLFFVKVKLKNILFYRTKALYS